MPGARLGVRLKKYCPVENCVSEMMADPLVGREQLLES